MALAISTSKFTASRIQSGMSSTLRPIPGPKPAVSTNVDDARPALDSGAARAPAQVKHVQALTKAALGQLGIDSPTTVRTVALDVARSPAVARIGPHGAPPANVVGAAEILQLGEGASSVVGGKNMNMARLNSIPGVRGAAFRAVTATAYGKHLDDNRIDPKAADAFLNKLFAATDFQALAHAEKDFQQQLVLDEGGRLGGLEAGSGPRVPVRAYLDQLIDRARTALAQKDLKPDERLAALRRLSMSAQIAILSVPLPKNVHADIVAAYHAIDHEVMGNVTYDGIAVAVRSSAVGEDSADAAFAGAQDTYLNITGAADVATHVKRNFASGFNVRALEYRLSQIDKEVQERGTPLLHALQKFDFNTIDVSVTIQQMIKSQKAGTAFSIDPASGLDNVVAIDANFGYGESVVGGRVTPDNYLVSKTTGLVARTLGKKDLMVVDKKGGGTHEVPTSKEQSFAWVLSDEELASVAQQVNAVERDYGCSMDTEFAIDGTGVYLVQARPETKFNQHHAQFPGVIPMKRLEVEAAALKAAVVLAKGDGASTGAATGTARFISNIHDPDIFERFKKGDILVAERTDPDFLTFFKLAKAVLANVGGRTSHAAITSRELGIPAVIGVGELDALKALDGKTVTVDGSHGAVYEGALPMVQKGEDLDVGAVKLLPTHTSVGLILADIDQAKVLAPLRAVPDFKVGLLRAEFVLGAIGVHYKALKAYDAGVLDEAIAVASKPGAAEATVKQLSARAGDALQAPGMTDRERLLLQTLTVADSAHLLATLEQTKAGVSDRLQKSGYATGHEFYVEMLSQKIALFAHAFEGKDVVYRTTDYKTNEYKGLMGGALFEGSEDNPMLGYRGVSRGVDAWEIEAFLKARKAYGATNLQLMFPFVRTEEELLTTMASAQAQGLKRGEDGLKVFVMAEIPSVATIPHTFLKHVDGFSIGSNDLTQGVLMTDRDSAKLQHTYDEQDPAVVQSMLAVIFAARKAGKEVGFCGQGVSNSEFLAAMVTVAGIDSASVTPDAYLKVKRLVHDIEQRGIGVAQLGAWMNDYRKIGMTTALSALAQTGAVDLSAAQAANFSPDDAFAWVQGALMSANLIASSAEAHEAGNGRAQLAALRKVTKSVIYANTDWRHVVDGALRTAGFDSAAQCDDVIAKRRTQHAQAHGATHG